jgi:transposase InsO family protein
LEKHPLCLGNLLFSQEVLDPKVYRQLKGEMETTKWADKLRKPDKKVNDFGKVMKWLSNVYWWFLLTYRKVASPTELVTQMEHMKLHQSNSFQGLTVAFKMLYNTYRIHARCRAGDKLNKGQQRDFKTKFMRLLLLSDPSKMLYNQFLARATERDTDQKINGEDMDTYLPDRMKSLVEELELDAKYLDKELESMKAAVVTPPPVPSTTDVRQVSSGQSKGYGKQSERDRYPRDRDRDRAAVRGISSSKPVRVNKFSSELDDQVDDPMYNNSYHWGYQNEKLRDGVYDGDRDDDYFPEEDREDDEDIRDLCDNMDSCGITEHLGDLQQNVIQVFQMRVTTDLGRGPLLVESEKITKPGYENLKCTVCGFPGHTADRCYVASADRLSLCAQELALCTKEHGDARIESAFKDGVLQGQKREAVDALIASVGKIRDAMPPARRAEVLRLKRNKFDGSLRQYPGRSQDHQRYGSMNMATWGKNAQQKNFSYEKSAFPVKVNMIKLTATASPMGNPMSSTGYGGSAMGGSNSLVEADSMLNMRVLTPGMSKVMISGGDQSSWGSPVSETSTVHQLQLQHGPARVVGPNVGNPSMIEDTARTVLETGIGKGNVDQEGIKSTGILAHRLQVREHDFTNEMEMALFHNPVPVNNNHLIYLGLEIEAATSDNSKGLREAVEEQNMDYSTTVASVRQFHADNLTYCQFDSGGATSIIGERYLEKLGGVIFRAKDPVKLAVADANIPSRPVLGVSAILVHVRGQNQRTGEETTRIIRVFAQVIPNSDQGLLVGADVHHQYTIEFLRSTRMARFFSGTPDELWVPWADMIDVERKDRTLASRLHSIMINRFAVAGIPRMDQAICHEQGQDQAKGSTEGGPLGATTTLTKSKLEDEEAKYVLRVVNKSLNDVESESDSDSESNMAALTNMVVPELEDHHLVDQLDDATIQWMKDRDHKTVWEVFEEEMFTPEVEEMFKQYDLRMASIGAVGVQGVSDLGVKSECMINSESGVDLGVTVSMESSVELTKPVETLVIDSAVSGKVARPAKPKPAKPKLKPGYVYDPVRTARFNTPWEKKVEWSQRQRRKYLGPRERVDRILNKMAKRSDSNVTEGIIDGRLSNRFDVAWFIRDVRNGPMTDFLEDEIERLETLIICRGEAIPSEYVARFIHTEGVQEYVHMVKLISASRPRELCPSSLRWDNSKEISISMIKLRQQEDEDLRRAELEVEEYVKRHCSDTSLDCLRPDWIPAEVWRYITNEDKKSLKSRARPFTESRIKEIIKDIMCNLDISHETPARKAESHLFKAQAVAHFDKWGHPDPIRPPRIKGKEFKITLIKEMEGKPPCNHRMRKLSRSEYHSGRCRQQHMLARDEIGRSEAVESTWNSPPLYVPQIESIQKFRQKHGDRAAEALEDPENAEDVRVLYRFTSDLRCLNARTQAELFTIPHITGELDRTLGCDRYSCNDIQDAFFTVALELASRVYTGFLTPDCHYHYKVMPQGAKNAANYWARVAHEMFAAMKEARKEIIVYQDDVCNFQKGLEGHLNTQREIYEALSENRAIFKVKKGHLNYRSQKILGHVLTAGGRLPDPGLVEAIIKLGIPNTIEGVRSVLGLAQVVREYIPGMALIISPIQQLTKKGADIRNGWTSRCQSALDHLILLLTSKPVLAQPDFTKPFRVEVDASKNGRGIGGVLLQFNEKTGLWHVVAYYSRALTDAERNYCATELECTALHDTILHWRVYLLNGAPFEVIVDHYALVYMVTKAGGAMTHQRLLRLCLDLQEYTFTVIHRQGKKHLLADAVSRLLQKDEQPYVRTADELRNDFEPLSKSEWDFLRNRYGIDADFMADTITEYREGKKQALEGQAQQEVDDIKSKSITTPLSLSSIVISEADRGKAHAEMVKVHHLAVDHLCRCHACDTFDSGYVKKYHRLMARQNQRWDVKIGRVVILERFLPEQLYRLRDEQSLRPCIRAKVEARVKEVKAQQAQLEQRLLQYSLKMNVIRVDPLRRNLEAQRLLSDRGERRSLRIKALGELRQAIAEQAEAERQQKQREAFAEQEGRQRRRMVRSDHGEPSSEDHLGVSSDQVKGVRSALVRDMDIRNPSTENRYIRSGRLRGVSSKQVRSAILKDQQLENIDTVVGNKLEDYHDLVARQYVDPEDQQLMEVVGVYWDKVLDLFMSKALPVVDGGPELGNLARRRAINGETGTSVLVLDLEVGDKIAPDWPQDMESWMNVQYESEELREIMDQLQAVGTIKDIRRSQNDPPDYLVRARVGDQAGALLRKFDIIRHIQRGQQEVQWTESKTATVVPRVLIGQCMKMYHEGLGHPGGSRTKGTIRLGYYWPGMNPDIQAYCKACRFCQRRKADNRRATIPVRNYDDLVDVESQKPFYRVHVDLMGPLPVTDRGHRYVMVVKDALTKWIEIFALQNKEAETVAECIADEVFYRHGAPRMVITDQGTEFTNRLMGQLMRITGCHHIKTTPANPQSNGLAENQNRTLKDMLASYINDHQTNWDEKIALVAFDYRTTINDATGYTPYYLLYGRECSRPSEEHMEQIVDQYPEGLLASAQQHAEVMRWVWNYVARRKNVNVETMNKEHKRLPFVEYSVGDYVFLRHVPKRFYKDVMEERRYALNRKLQLRWIGPYRVVRKFNPVLYQVEVNDKLKTVHAVNMKHW